MTIADTTVTGHGEFTITINDEKKLKVKGGKSLLNTLMLGKIFIPSACGGRAACGLCKVKVKSGAEEYNEAELRLINPDERKQSIHLACQCNVKNNYEIYIPNELFKIKQFITQVVKLRDLTYDIKEVTLKLLNPEEIEFQAGQYIHFQVPVYELTSQLVYRAYSISSPPSAKNIIELEIRYVPDGICTTYVHKYLKEGKKIIVNGPYGEFYLRESERNIIFIAGGSGMAPIKAILLDMAEKNINRKAMYFFGARSCKDLFLLEEMAEIERKLPNFKFIPALSQLQPGDNWNGETGLITDVVVRLLPSGENTEAYLCGSPGMIDACVKVLKKKGIPEELIYYDKFA